MTAQRWFTPTIVHGAALVLGFVAIMVIGRDQWFFGDDWAILAPRLDDDVMLPHVGHWNLVPALVFPLLRDWFGLGSYLPFLALAVIVHLVVVHLLWRVLLRVGVAPWLATVLGVLVMLFGGGAENILWAFQFGFMGAIAAGLGVALLFDRDRLTRFTIPAIVLLALVAPMFSGTAIPVLAAAAITGWVRHGFWRAAVLMVPTAVAYLSWYLLVARDYAVPSAGITDVTDLLTAVVYAGAMYGGGLGRALPFIGLGVLPALAVIVWFVRTVRAGIDGRRTLAYAMVLGSIVFVLLTTWSRLSFGISAAAAQRYAYVTVVLLLPALGLMLTGLLVRSRAWRVATLAVVGALALFNAGLLVVEAGLQSAREAGSRERVLDSLEHVLDAPDDATLLDSPADPTWAPDLLGSDLLELESRGDAPRR